MLELEEYGQAEVFDEWLPTVRNTARLWANRYPHLQLEQNEVANELWAWLLSPKRIDWLVELKRDRPEKQVQRKVAMRLRDVAKGYCLVQHAKRLGYQLDDLSWYSRGQITELLPVVLNGTSGWVMPGEVSDEQQPGRRPPRRPDEGGNRLATLADIAQAFHGLRVVDQQVLVLRYGGSGMTARQIADVLEVEEPAAEKRVHRAVDRLLERLGGEPPIWPKGARE